MSQKYEIKVPIDENNFNNYKNWLYQLSVITILL